MSSDCLRVENKVMKEIYLYDDDVIEAQLLTRSPLIPMSPLKPGKPSSPWNKTEMRFASNSLVISLYCFWRHFFISHSETFFPPFHWDLIKSPDSLYLLNMWITGCMLPSAGRRVEQHTCMSQTMSGCWNKPLYAAFTCALYLPPASTGFLSNKIH